MVAPGHFNLFYARDFSWCCRHLMELGYEKEVHSTLEYALTRYRRHGRIAVAIGQNGKPFDFPKEAIDSIPSIIRSLRDAQAYDLIRRFKGFVEDEARRFHNQFIDSRTGLVRPGHFSSIKDHYKRHSCCYDNCMAAMLSDDLNSLGLENPLNAYGYQTLLRDTFYTGRFFREERGTTEVTGDSNVFPFWCGIFNDNGMLERCMESIENAGLAKHLPLRYSASKIRRKTIAASLLAPGYEDDTIWMHIGSVFLELQEQRSREHLKSYLDAFTSYIERSGTFLELYQDDGRPFTTLLYVTEESMLWASVYLNMRRRYTKKKISR